MDPVHFVIGVLWMENVNGGRVAACPCFVEVVDSEYEEEDGAAKCDCCNAVSDNRGVTERIAYHV
jgi:hypothetical protein